jgi:hypothetical protein
MDDDGCFWRTCTDTPDAPADDLSSKAAADSLARQCFAWNFSR